MKTIGVICAMESEFECIRQTYSHGTVKNIGLMSFYVAQQGEKQVVASVCGIGKVNAAACAQMMISVFGAECLINSGVAGALSKELHIMDIVAATDVVYHDLEARLLEGDYFPHCAHFPTDPKLSGLVEEICREQGVPCLCGRIASGEQFVTDSRLKEAIIAGTQAISVEMEGAAIGHVCYLNQIPFTVVRCMSDGADDNGAMDFDTFVGKAAQRCAGITLELIARM